MQTVRKSERRVLPLSYKQEDDANQGQKNESFNIIFFSFDNQPVIAHNSHVGSPFLSLALKSATSLRLIRYRALFIERWPHTVFAYYLLVTSFIIGSPRVLPVVDCPDLLSASHTGSSKCGLQLSPHTRHSPIPQSPIQTTKQSKIESSAFDRFCPLLTALIFVLIIPNTFPKS